MRENHDPVLLEHGQELVRDLCELRDMMVAQLAHPQVRGNLTEEDADGQLRRLAIVQGCIAAADGAREDAKKRNR